jgi:hypothetical protein
MEHRLMSDVVYLYGFVPVGTSAPPRDVTGVGCASVRLLDVGPVRAAVSDVSADTWGAGPIEARLQDMAWVGEQGVAHERVVTWFADHSDILPARMFSLYSGDEPLRAAVAPRADEVAASLRALAGRREWDLKVAYDASQLARHGAEVSPELQRLDEEAAAATPGRRYLLERQRADVLKQELGRAARTLAEELLDGLRPHALDVRTLPRATGDDAGNVVLNAALLVARDHEQALRATARDLWERHDALGMIVSFSGPWAPYRFVEPYGDA